MSALKITPIPALSDNYIWCIQSAEQCTVVDPGEAAPVLEWCEQQELSLVSILITHHHWDHTNGIEELLKRFPGIPVYGPAAGNIAHLTHRLVDGDAIHLTHGDLALKIIEVPGHTLDHIAYVSPEGVFCGDTLFSAGCGRLFEGTPAQMHHSLQKLAALPDSMPVYCTHEYTLANLAFAAAVEPENSAREQFQRWAEQQISLGQPTLPSYIEREKQINPFLRTSQKAIILNAEQYVGEKLHSPEAIFSAIRGWKDNF